VQGAVKPASGYGLLLVAETTSGRFIGAERCVSGIDLLRCRRDESTPADIGDQVACMLLDEIKRCALQAATGNGSSYLSSCHSAALREVDLSLS
jgi:hypothetical protein